MVAMSHSPVSSSFSFAEPPRAIGPAIRRGFGLHCPACGEGSIFGRFLKVNDACARCGTELHHHRADDAPPYFTIFIVGHLIIPLLLLLERQAMPPTWVHMALWLPLTLLLSLWFLPRIKGALIGFQWAKRMHGFGGEHD